LSRILLLNTSQFGPWTATAPLWAGLANFWMLKPRTVTSAADERTAADVFATSRR
jgi:hypothetical protein